MNRFLLSSASTLVMLAGLERIGPQGGGAGKHCCFGHGGGGCRHRCARQRDERSGTKREASQIVDAISAEDIGKLPDNSVSEAVQRVTGVQIRALAATRNRW